MAKYRKKPVIVEAVQYDGTRESLLKIIQLQSAPSWMKVDEGDLLIPTLEGVIRAKVGDYVIKGVQGELYPCKPDIFEQTYEPVDTHSVENTRKTNDVKEGASKVKVTVVLTNGVDGYYVAECPELPGCVSQGKTREEAINNIKEAIQLTIQTRKKLGLPDFDVNVETVELYIS